MKLSELLVTGEPLIYAGMVAIVLVSTAIIFILTYFKKWGWLWREWLTTLDHKKIGIMYILIALAMLFRAGTDELMMRTELALPNMNFMDAEHYNEIFTTHGTIMMLFNVSFVIGGSPDAGWTNYAPLAGSELSPGPGINFYLLGLQLSGIGTLATGINLLVTILRRRAPGMKMFKMPIFTWSSLITSF